MSKYLPKIPPWKHQLEALKKGHGCRAFAYLMGTGTGKTKVVIDDAVMHYEAGRINTLIVFSNKGSYRNWPNTEIPEHMPERIKYASYLWDGKRTKKKQYEYEYLAMFDGMKLMFFNIESLSSASGSAAELVKHHMMQNDSMLVIDESSTIKNFESIRTKNAISLGRSRGATYRRIMTGTPVTKGPLNLFSQFQFLQPGLLGFSSYYTYRARYSILRGLVTDKKTGETTEWARDDKSGEFVEIDWKNQRGFKIPVAWRNLDELGDRIAPYSYRVLKEDCLDLPEKMYQKRETFMTDEQQHIYETMRKESIAELDAQEYVISTHVLAKRLRLHQITCGFLPKEDKTIHWISNAKVESLMEALEECGGKACIWVDFRPSFLRIAEALKEAYGEKSFVEYHGGISPEQRERNRLSYLAGDHDWFVGNPSVGGKGLTLVVANNSYYFSNTDNLENRLQSEDRIHRPGQHWPCTYTDLLVPGTVDVSIIENLRKGVDVARRITKDNYREWI